MTSLRNEESKYLARNQKPTDLEICRSEGSYLVDENGKKYIDFTSGWCVGNLGWGNRIIEKTVSEFQGPTYVSPGHYYEPWVELAKLLAEISPGKLTKCFRATGGTEAVEFALRAAMAHTGRHKILSVENSYHGNSMGTLKIGPTSFHRQYRGYLFPSEQITPPLDFTALEELENALKTKDVAAFIMEPVILNHAVYIPKKEFMKELHRLCSKYGTLLIMDEVASGFGRTGKLFASEHFGITPDIMCLGKAISGGYSGMGAMIATEEVANSLEAEGGHYSTYGWHPLSTQVALANIKYILTNKDLIFKNIEEIGMYIVDRLSGLNFGSPIKEVRAKGLAIAMELERPGNLQGIIASAKQEGLIVGGLGEATLVLFPALNLEHSIAESALDILENCTRQFKIAA